MCGSYVFVIYISLISDVSERKYSCCHKPCCSALFTDCCSTFALLFRGRITARRYSFHRAKNPRCQYAGWTLTFAVYTRDELLALNRHDVTPAGVSGRLFLVTGCGGHYVNDGTSRPYSSTTRRNVPTPSAPAACHWAASTRVH